jgi:hypothetical protein
MKAVRAHPSAQSEEAWGDAAVKIFLRMRSETQIPRTGGSAFSKSASVIGGLTEENH